MARLFAIFFLITLIFQSAALAQTGPAPIRIFGYFQTTLQYENGAMAKSSEYEQDISSTSFFLQHLNLFLQKDLAKDWTSFIDFKFTDNFSSSRNWGTFDLDEAWVRYRASKRLNLKIGLQIPIFNNLNEIKNRTPILPYIMRPMVYESTFRKFVALDEFVPNRTFFQVYGFIPHDLLKMD